jgi:hypothetical protein
MRITLTPDYVHTDPGCLLVIISYPKHYVGMYLHSDPRPIDKKLHLVVVRLNHLKWASCKIWTTVQNNNRPWFENFTV